MTTYMTHVIANGVTYDEDKPGRIEVVVSIGEFPDGETELEITAGTEFIMVGLSLQAQLKLVLALQESIKVHRSNGVRE